MAAVLRGGDASWGRHSGPTFGSSILRSTSGGVGTK
jgi:hypothetical protein